MSDSPSIERLLDHASFARRLARALVLDDARADDVVQQAWVNALEHPPPDGREGRGLKSWLATVVRNTASKLRREELRREQREQRAATPEPLPPTSDVAAQLAAQRELVDAVARLDEPYRSTVHARFFEERTPTAIAKAQSLPVRTVETRLRRALEQLRADLDRRFAGGRDAWAGLLLPFGGAVVATKTSIGIGVAAALVVVAGATLYFGGGSRWATREGVAGPEAALASDDESAPRPLAPTSARANAPERAAPLVAERAAIGCTVTVVDPDRTGVANASLVLFRGDELLGEARTDESGAARLPIVPADAAECELYVDPGCAPWRTLAVAPGTTALEIAIEEGARLAGRVVVEGCAPDAAIRLQVTSFGPPVPARRAPSRAIERSLKVAKVILHGDLFASSDAAGRFVFFGLPPHEHVEISLPIPYETAADGSSSVRIREPTTDLRLDLRLHPSIRGRVVDRAGEPVAGWKVEGRVASSLDNRPLVAAASDGDGRFELFLHQKLAASRTATVFVRDPAGVVMASEEFEGDFDRGGEVGDVVVDRERLLALDARDEQGAAIDPFVVVVALAPRSAAAPAPEPFERKFVVDAAHARSGFGLPPDVARISVVAAGFASKAVSAEPGSRAVPLARCASLFLALRDEQQRALPHETLEISASRWPVAWSRAELLAAHGAFKGAEVADKEAQEPTTARFKSMSGGGFRIAALEPELPLELVLRDRLGVELRRETVTLAAGEKRVLQWTPECPAFELTGTVRSEGAPLQNARLFFFEFDRQRNIDATTGADGRFKIEGVRARRGTLVAECVHFISQERSDVEVGAGRDHDFDLVRGRQLTCWFNDASGKVKPDEIWIERQDAREAPDAADERPPSEACFEMSIARSKTCFSEVLPPEPLVVRARIGGFVHAFAFPNSTDGTGPGKGSSLREFDVSMHGPVVIDWTIASAASSGRTLAALRLLPQRRDTQITCALPPADVERGAGVARFEKVPPDLYVVALVWSDASGELIVERTDLQIDLERDESAQLALTR